MLSENIQDAKDLLEQVKGKTIEFSKAAIPTVLLEGHHDMFERYDILRCSLEDDTIILHFEPDANHPNGQADIYMCCAASGNAVCTAIATEILS